MDLHSVLLVAVHLIAGLGNPGRRYERTRHNIGFMLVDRLAEQAGLRYASFGKLALIARGYLGDQSVILLKPQTYMNLSGQAVYEVSRYFDLAPADSLIIFDDAALSLGTIRFRSQGSAGGHKGMQSVIECLGTQQVPRLRLGISPASQCSNLSAFVLSRFSDDQLEVVTAVLERSQEGVAVFLRDGIDEAMARFN